MIDESHKVYLLLAGDGRSVRACCQSNEARTVLPHNGPRIASLWHCLFSIGSSRVTFAKSFVEALMQCVLGSQLGRLLSSSNLCDNPAGLQAPTGFRF